MHIRIETTRVSLKAIAETVGVSPATVSYALRGRPGVSSAMRDKVRKIAEEMGYRPDPMVSALAETRWRKEKRSARVNLALLTRKQAQEEALFVARAERIGYSLSPVYFDALHNPAQLNRMLRALSARGVIIYDPRGRDHFIYSACEAIKWNACSWVSVREGGPSLAVHRVHFNTFGDVQRALRNIAHRGYRRIAFLREIILNHRVNARQSGAFLEFQAARRGEIDCLEVEMAYLGNDNSSPVRPELAKAVQAFQPDALLLSYTGLHRRLPEDLQQLPWASFSFIAESVSSIAGIRMDLELMARWGIDFLDLLLRRGEYGLAEKRQTLLIDSDWTDGPTLPHASATTKLRAHR